MRVILCVVAAISLFLGSGAFAEDAAVVKWERIETVPGNGAIVQPSPVFDLPGDETIRPSARWRTVGPHGHAQVNLNTGAVSFTIDGLSVFWNTASIGATALGSPDPGAYRGTVVCHATRPDEVVFADTAPVQLVEGSASFEGTVTLPWQCADAPSEVAFLIRHHGGAVDGIYVAYGAVRTVRGGD